MTAKDLEGKLAVMTGANSGIGFEACVQLAERGCEIVMCCRNLQKAEEAKSDVIKRSKCDPSKVHVAQLDLADLDNVGSFRSRYDAIPGLAQRPVDMLICNAGVMALPKREATKQGLEAQMGTNVVGHFKFVAVMIDLCKAAAKSRIVTVSSIMHKTVSKIVFEDFNREKSYSSWQAYGESKLGNLLLTAKLQRILDEKGVTNILAVASHPGYTATNLQQHDFFTNYIFNHIVAQRAPVGAQTTVLAATDPDAPKNGYVGPTYFFEMRGTPKWGAGKSKAADDLGLQDKLWEKCEEIAHCNLASKL